MMKQNTSILLKKWITDNKSEIIRLGIKQIESRLRVDFPDLVVDAYCKKFIFDTMFPEKIHLCDKSKFVSQSVGYRNCEKNCPCYIKQIADRVRQSKQKYTDEQRQSILEKRTNTVMTKYGVSNVFQDESVKKQASVTKLKKYGDANYRNDDKIKTTMVDRYGSENPMNSDFASIGNDVL